MHLRPELQPPELQGIMTAPWGDPIWRKRALCAITEGFCPLHHGPLALDAEGSTFTSYHEPMVTAFPSGGWCRDCQIWWRTEMVDNGQQVVANYPRPVPAIAPYSASTTSAAT